MEEYKSLHSRLQNLKTWSKLIRGRVISSLLLMVMSHIIHVSDRKKQRYVKQTIARYQIWCYLSQTSSFI